MYRTLLCGERSPVRRCLRKAQVSKPVLLPILHYCPDNEADAIREYIGTYL